MNTQYNYVAFISYKSEDVEWAIWLQHELEHYHLPASYNGRTDVRQELRPVFRDIDELSAGNLPEQIKHALVNSENLIVICSPQAAKSPWVNQEVETFISLGKVNQIFPFIVEGDSPKEFFPPSLLNLPKNEERLGGDVSKNGRDAAFVKVVAGMLGVGFDSLWNRYEKEKAEEERKIREQRDHLLRVQSRFLAEKANALIEEGDSYTARLLALEALPKDIENPNRPYTVEAESALRHACQNEDAIFKGHHSTIYSANSNLAGTLIVSASEDKTIRIWDAFSGCCLNILHGHVDGIRYAAFSPDGTRIVSASKDKTVRIWDSITGQCLKTMQGHNGKVNAASFSPDGTRIVSASWDSTIRIWDVISGKCLKTIQEDMGRYYSIAFSPNGKHIISSTTNHLFFIISKMRESLQSPEDSMQQDTNKDVMTNGKNRVSIWDTETGQCVKSYHVDGGDILSSSFSPKGEKVIFTLRNRTIHIKCLSRSQCSQIIYGHTDNIASVSYDSAGTRIISTSWDKSIRIWDAITGQCLNVLRGHTESVFSASFHPNGKYIASASGDKTIRIWDVSRGCCLHVLKGHLGVVWSVVFSQDGKIIISASQDMTLRVWDFQEGRCLKIIEDKDCLTSASLSPDSKYIISSSVDKCVRIWEVSTGKRVISLYGHTDIINSVSINFNGSRIISASADKSICVWDFPGIQKLISQTCEKFKNRTLMEEERKKYYLD